MAKESIKMTNTYLILTKEKWESALPAKLKTADRLSWNEYTYKDVEKTAKRMVNKYDYYPSDDNTKAEIKAYMDDCGVDYSSSDTKAELLEKLNAVATSVPQVEEEYKYTAQEIDTTTLQNPTWKESAFKLGKLGNPRWNNDGSKVVVKYELAIADGTLDVVKDISGITALSYSEAIEEMKKDEWIGE
jgi:hypothetical protein